MTPSSCGSLNKKARLDVREIADYCRCPLLYYFRHRLKIHQPANRAELLEAALCQVAYYMFNLISGGGAVKVSYLKQVLGQAWRESCRRYALPGQTYSSALVSGLEAVLTMHEKLGKNPGRPLLVNHTYRAVIGSTEVTGHIDLLREREGVLELVCFQLRRTVAGETIGHNPALLLTALTVRQLLRRPVTLVSHYYFLDGTLVSSTIPASPGGNVRAALANVIRGISQHIFFPVVNDNCRQCTYWSLCNSLDWRLDRNPVPAPSPTNKLPS